VPHPRFELGTSSF